MSAVEWIAVVAGYMFGAAAWCAWCGFMKYEAEGPATMIGAAFWPAAILLVPAIAAYSLGEKARKKELFKRKPKPPPDKPEPVCPICKQRSAYR